MLSTGMLSAEREFQRLEIGSQPISIAPYDPVTQTLHRAFRRNRNVKVNNALVQPIPIPLRYIVSFIVSTKTNKPTCRKRGSPLPLYPFIYPAACYTHAAHSVRTQCITSIVSLRSAHQFHTVQHCFCISLTSPRLFNHSHSRGYLHVRRTGAREKSITYRSNASGNRIRDLDARIEIQAQE